ncbi:MAG: hypothetical protein QW175_06250 [Candidatus Bathyarchaeia archaeon]
MRFLSRAVKRDLLRFDGDVCGLLFVNKRSQRACRLFLCELKRKGFMTRAELSRFAWDLSRGKVEPGFRYARCNFYTTVKRTLMCLGLITVRQRYVGGESFSWEPRRGRKMRDVVDVYVPVLQPIPMRPPDGVNLPRLIWNVCKAWNDFWQT